jgi:hypothetical protein
MGQGKARPAGNGQLIAEGRNAAWAHGKGFRRTRLPGRARTVVALACISDGQCGTRALRCRPAQAR